MTSLRHVARMPKSTKTKRLRDSYRFPGFHPALIVVGLFGDPHARVIRLTRRSKKNHVRGVRSPTAGVVRQQIAPGPLPSGGMRIYLEIDIRRIDCRSCEGVKQERLDCTGYSTRSLRRPTTYTLKQRDDVLIRPRIAGARRK
jgi:hypothetical protein